MAPEKPIEKRFTMTIWDDLEAELETKRAAHLHRQLKIVPPGALDLASNDYLGLSRHPEVVAAAQNAIAEFGAGARASRLISGNYPLLTDLESALSDFKKTEGALVFSSGYAANIGVLGALSNPQTALFCHKRNHASLVDGCRFGFQNGAQLRFWETSEKLEMLLKTARLPRKIVVADGVFSMDGDLLPLPEILDLCEKYDAILLLDDAHGTGTLGETGRGIAEHFGAASERIVWLGTLSKALGSQGGFVCGPRVLIETLLQSARSFIYSTGLHPAAASAALAALQILRREPQKLEVLRFKTQFLAQCLADLGWDVRPQPSPILPVVVGESARAVEISARLLQQNLWCPAIRPPTVAQGTARLRLGMDAGWTTADLNRIMAGFAAII